MNLKKLIKIYSDKGCTNVYVKTLAANDNSKNQVYFGGNFEVLNILPFKEITSVDAGDWKRDRFKTKLDYYWLTDDGNISHAPDSQLILYPKYPEVRFSGFLKGSKNAPSDLMANRIEQRLLFIGVDPDGKIIGYVTAPDSELANEFNKQKGLETSGIFKVITIQNKGIQKDTKDQLLKELQRIHKLGWIKSKRLNAAGNIIDCTAPQCGGYTLEAELGIIPNGYSDPDFLGWEVKQFSVKNFLKYNSSIITLMTPEPTHGFYAEQGVRKFVEKFGYKDKRNREDRMNFGGLHKSGIVASATGLTLTLIGFDINSGKIINTDGRIALIDKKDNEAASWSFTSMLKHWNKKHAKASYVPSLLKENGGREYSYGNNVILGTGTDFNLFLKQMALGNIYYDPGIKVENVSTKPKVKARSQFRVKSLYLPELYRNNEVVDLTRWP